MKKLFSKLKPYILPLIILIIVTYLQVQANLKLPDYMIKIVNEGIINEDLNTIYRNGGMMILITLAGGILSVIVGFLSSQIATGYAKDIRKEVFEKIESFSINEFNKFSTASLITRSTNDIQQIQMVFIMLLRMVLMAPFMAIGGLQKALSMAPSMSWIIAVSVIAMFAMIITLFAIGMPKFQILQTLIDKLNLVTRENLTGLRVVRAFNNEKREEKKFDGANTDLTHLNLFVNRLMSIMQPVMGLVLNLSAIGIVWYGAHLIDQNSLQIGDMMAFMQYATQVIMSFVMVSIIFIMVPRASVSLKRISEIVNTQSSILDPKQPQSPNLRGKGMIEFEHVTFKYPHAQEPLLNNISFKAMPGQTTAIIGSTGSGKSTLINLIPRLYDVTEGRILLDGVDIRNMTQAELHSLIGYVPQKGVLFSGTIQSNIKYGKKDASYHDINRAADIAQASEFIQRFEDKYDHEIAEGGSNVSGGQKQRLSIARAIAVQPKVYIFDDSFSALDFKTDAKLRKALQEETKDKTVIIVAQRISTIMQADKIIVLDEGKIVGEGTHQKLLEKNKVYREIAYSQLSDKELKDIKTAERIK